MKIWIIVGYDVECNDHSIYEIWSSHDLALESLERHRKKHKHDRIRFQIESWSVLS